MRSLDFSLQDIRFLRILSQRTLFIVVNEHLVSVTNVSGSKFAMNVNTHGYMITCSTLDIWYGKLHLCFDVQ